MSPAARRLRRPGRTSGLFNLGIALAVLAVLLPLLLNAATSAPPTAAEFSPNATQVIKTPPPGAHLRIHPILHWTEADIWAYTRRENIPIIPLYLARDGKRYRSLGDADITFPVVSDASSIDEILLELERTKVPERAGRALDHETEDAFERLRVAGYL